MLLVKHQRHETFLKHSSQDLWENSEHACAGAGGVAVARNASVIPARLQSSTRPNSRSVHWRQGPALPHVPLKKGRGRGRRGDRDTPVPPTRPGSERSGSSG